MIFQILGYLKGLSSHTVITEDLMFSVYSLTSFLLLSMAVLVTGKTFLSEPIICTLNVDKWYEVIFTLQS